MKERLKSVEEVLDAFTKIGKAPGVVGIDTSGWESNKLRETYGDKTAWYMLYNPPFGEVLHSITDLGEKGPLWESFAIVKGFETSHWLHFLSEEFPNGMPCETDSPCKPDECYNRKWFAYRIKDMTPYLMQGKKIPEFYDG